MLAGLGLKRGDVVLVAAGKPRPAVIIQSDLLTTPDQILVCPLTTTLIDMPLCRLPILPDVANGLRHISHLMVDQAGAVRRSRIDGVIGRLDDTKIEQLSDALRFVMDLVP